MVQWTKRGRSKVLPRYEPFDGSGDDRLFCYREQTLAGGLARPADRRCQADDRSPEGNPGAPL
jgi:hypothetical protein